MTTMTTPMPTGTPLGAALLDGRFYQVELGADRLDIGEYAIRFADITDLRVTDSSYEVRKCPTWAIVLAIIGAFFFLLGLLFLLVKETQRVPRATVTVYTATRAFPFQLAGTSPQQAYDRWYPLFAATGRT
jgi:hypothetical protein